MGGITGILLNWKRPANVERIAAGWRAQGTVTEAIIWNNNREMPLGPITGATVINASEDLGLYTRFAAVCLARNECVLIQDDDLELPRPSLAALYDAWNADPEILHGVFGRNARADGSYAQSVSGDADVSVVLTRVLFTHRRYAARFFEIAPRFAEIQRDSQPAGNGEDILFNYVVQKSSGRLNRIHNIAVTELPAEHAIYQRNLNAHAAHRTRLMRACAEWLKSPPEVANQIPTHR